MKSFAQAFRGLTVLSATAAVVGGGAIGGALYVAIAFGTAQSAPQVQQPTQHVQVVAATSSPTAAPVKAKAKPAAVKKAKKHAPTTTKKVATLQAADAPQDAPTQAPPALEPGDAANGSFGPGQPGWDDTSAPSDPPAGN